VVFFASGAICVGSHLYGLRAVLAIAMDFSA
jgi:hypothetical protein